MLLFTYACERWGNNSNVAELCYCSRMHVKDGGNNSNVAELCYCSRMHVKDGVITQM